MSWWIRRTTLKDMTDAADRIPRGFGIAWRSKSGGELVFMPIPVNVVAGLARAGWQRLHLGVRPSYVDHHRAAAFVDGVDAGKAQAQLEFQRRFALAIDPAATIATVAEAAAGAQELVELDDVESRFLEEAGGLISRKGINMILACPKPQCARDPVLTRIDKQDGSGFWLNCPHARRWVPAPFRGKLTDGDFRRAGFFRD